MLFLPAAASAASIVWVGGSDHNWSTAANWSPAQVPTAADAAVIDVTTSVLVPPGAAAAFQSLTLGDAAGSTSPQLQVQGTLNGTGSLVLYSGATLQQATTQQLVLGQLTAASGATLTHLANAATRQYALNLNVAGNMTLAAGSSILVDGMGYQGGQGVSLPGAGPGGGPGYGGAGGHGGMGAGGGAAYDSATNPTDLGSGGGGGPPYYGGSAGGGAVILNIAGTLTLNGLISANGNPGGNQGAGAGGTVNVTVGTLTGTGTVRADGGVCGGGNGGNCGGGGRVAITVTGSDTSNLQVRADAGTGSNVGGAGTIAVMEPGASAYSLIVGTAAAVPGALTPVSGSFAAVTLGNGFIAFDTTTPVQMTSLVALDSATVTAGTLAFNGGGVQVDGGGTLIFSASALSAASLYVKNGGTFQQAMGAPLSFSNVAVDAGGALSHAHNAATRQYLLNLNVAGNMTLAAGSSILVDGMGYQGGQGISLPGAGSGGGPGYGGAGGHGGMGAGGGAAYDSATNPIDLGSGGGGGAPYYSGSSGGGAVILNVSGTLALNGLISANGNPGGNQGAGAGGTVNVTAGTLTGTGTVRADGGVYGGGNGGSNCGGGGRVAITVTGSDTSNLQVRADAGTGSNVGGAGTIAFQEPGASGYSLVVGTSAIVPGMPTSVPGASVVLATVTLSNAVLNFDPGSAVQLGYLNAVGQATMTANNLTFASGGAMAVVGGTLTVSAASISGANLVVAGGGWFQSSTPISRIPVPGSSLAFPLVTLGASNVAFDSLASVQVGGVEVYGPSTMTVAGLTFVSGSALEINNGGFLALSAGSLSGANLLVHTGGTFMQSNAAALSLNSASVDAGGTLTHASNGASKTAALVMTVAGNFTLSSGGQINADGRGYQGGAAYPASGVGYGPGGGGPHGYVDGAGAGHGGAGAGGDNGSVGGVTYDSPVDPSDLGSGGGSGAGAPGGAGGGEAQIQVGGTFALNGLISANGATGFNNNGLQGGSGSGGTINISAGAVTGSGTVRANGGAGAGGGGGGCIFVSYGGPNAPLALQAAGGSGNAVGANGTIFGNVIQFDSLAPSSSTAMAQMQSQLSASQTLSETISAQTMNYTIGVASGVMPSIAFGAQVNLATIQTGSFAGKGFFTGTWTLPTQAGGTVTGQWQGMAQLNVSPRQMVLHGDLEGGMRGVLQGVLTESVPGSGNFDQLALNGQVIEFLGALGTGSEYFSGTAPSVQTTSYPGVSLMLMQEALTGQGGGDFTSPLQTNFTLIRVNDTSNPYYGEGFFQPTYTSSLGFGEGWAFARTVGQEVLLQGSFGPPLLGLFNGELLLSSPGSLYLSVESLSVGAGLAPNYVLNKAGPYALNAGSTATFSASLTNIGSAATSITLVAIYPEWTDFVWASGNYAVYKTPYWIGNTFAAKPFVRWDDVVVAPGTTSTFYFQAYVRPPGPGAPPAHTAVTWDVRAVPTNWANQVFAPMHPGLSP